MSKRDLKIGDIPHKPIHVPKPKIPKHLEPVGNEPLPIVKPTFWDKVKTVVSDVLGFIPKAFGFAQDAVKAVNGLNASIKWIVFGLILVVVLVIIL